jgi:hypothetical protein
MRTWRLSDRGRRCGGCDARIAKDDPIQVFRLPGTEQYLRVRCVRCADEPFEPEKLATSPPREPLTPAAGERPMQPLRSLALDFKQRQFAERQPGEDDV